jgi:hypothetical protein
LDVLQQADQVPQIATESVQPPDHEDVELPALGIPNEGIQSGAGISGSADAFVHALRGLPASRSSAGLTSRAERTIEVTGGAGRSSHIRPAPIMFVAMVTAAASRQFGGKSVEDLGLFSLLDLAVKGRSLSKDKLNLAHKVRLAADKVLHEQPTTAPEALETFEAARAVVAELTGKTG